MSSCFTLDGSCERRSSKRPRHETDILPLAELQRGKMSIHGSGLGASGSKYGRRIWDDLIMSKCLQCLYFSFNHISIKVNLIQLKRSPNWVTLDDWMTKSRSFSCSLFLTCVGTSPDIAMANDKCWKSAAKLWRNSAWGQSIADQRCNGSRIKIIWRSCWITPRNT